VTPPADNAAMEEDGVERVGSLTARVWFQHRSIVVRVTSTPDLAGMAPVSTVVATRRALHREIDRWLRDMGYVEQDELDDLADRGAPPRPERRFGAPADQAAGPPDPGLPGPDGTDA
jgi:hypothetical protein